MPTRLPERLQAAALSDPHLEKLKARDGRVQFGTLGRGNHFLEFQADREGQVWLMVHSGSRAVGQAITAHHLAHAEAASNGLVFLEADSPQGRVYLSDASWAIDYAQQNRLAMVAAVADLVEDLFGVVLDEDSLIQSDHNHVRRETHFGRPL